MARKRAGAKAFSFNIVLVPKEVKNQRIIKLQKNSNQWKKKALHLAKMQFWYQWKKSIRKAEQVWYKFYSVNRYGAPSTSEFICPVSGLVAKTVKQEEAISFRNYWIQCAKKSKEIFEWLNSIDFNNYSAEIHSYLYTLIIFPMPILREVKIYELDHPFVPSKSWQQTEKQNTMKN